MEFASKIQFRTIVHNQVTYIRKEDVAELLIELGSSEDADVQNRLWQMAANVMGLSMDTKTHMYDVPNRKWVKICSQ